MSNEVKRYDPINSDGTCGMCIEDADYGAYVEYADYAALEAELAKLRAGQERRAVDGWKLVKTGAGCVTSGMKAACIGEFSFGIQMACGECVDCGADSDCPVCGGEVEYTQKITVPWDTCKEIYKAMLAAAPSAPKADDPVKVQLLEALEELMYAHTDKAEALAESAIAAARRGEGE